MSIQNNLDIIVNSQKTAELKVSSDQIQASKQSVSYNFDELLRASQKENEVKTAETPKSEKIEEKSEVAKTEDSKKSEKTEAKSETKKSEKDEKSENAEEATEVRGEKFVAANVEAEEETTANVKTKLTEADFSNINQIAENAEVGAAEVSVELKDQIKNLKTAEIAEDDKSKAKDVKLSSEVLDNAGQDFEAKIAKNLEMKSGNSEGENELDFTGKHSEDAKVSKLDKDGKITVRDERTKTPVEETKASEKAEPKAKTEVKITGENTATITMDMAQNTETDVLALNDQTAASNGSNYQTMFANQLQEAAPDFVKAGQIILKDNNQGTINLVLHPDDMGNVKIHLSLDGKSVSAQITVATKEAMQIFKDNAETLREAFIKQGFENASFDVSYSGSDSGLGQNSEFGGQNDGRELYANKTYNQYAVAEDSSFIEFNENTLNSGNYSVNIVA